MKTNKKGMMAGMCMPYLFGGIIIGVILTIVAYYYISGGKILFVS